MTTTNGKGTAEAQIRALIDARATAIRTKNAARVVAQHAADFVQYSLAPPLISAGADERGLEAWFATWRGPIGYEIRDLSVTAGDDVAFSRGLVRMSGTKNDGDKSDIWFRLTSCFRKIGGTWKIAHEHESVPFYMDGSYRAAVDLKP